MTSTHYVKTLFALFTGATFLVPALALAQLNSTNINTSLDTKAEVRTNTTQVRTDANVSARAAYSATTTARMERAREKAAQELKRRVDMLVKLGARIEQASKISDQFKANLNTNVGSQVTALTDLRDKVLVEGDLDTLRADAQAITQSHRIFALVLAQTNIAAAADRSAMIFNMLVGVGSKLQVRLQELQNAGANITALAEVLSDMGAKLSEAQAKAQAAVNVTATLQSDNGDADARAANDEILTQSRENLRAAREALVEVRKDAAELLKGIRELSGGASTSVETSTDASSTGE